MPYALIYAMLCKTSFYYTGLYEYKNEYKGIDTFIRLSIGVALTAILFSAFLYFFPHEIVRRKLTVITSFFVFINGNYLRYIYFCFLESRKIQENILILGAGELAKETARLIIARKDFGFKVLGFLDENDARLGVSIVNPSIIGTYDEVHQKVMNLNVDRIVVAVKDKRGRLPMDDLVQCKTQGKKVEDAIHFYERLMGKLYIENLNPGEVVFSDGFQVSPIVKRLKRAMDIIGSVCMLFLYFPVIIFTSILIKLESHGPVIFSQERMGEDGKIFQVYKFRTMREDAESHTGPVWASECDPRITRVGRFLRKTRLDEIPQFWNVLKGDMSFVGPRPERPFFVEKLKRGIPYYLLRTAAKPGITGWAQIKYKYGATVEDAKEKLRYDLYYIKNMSLILDLCIIWQTVKVVLFGKGAH
jgi:sugar transferase (PEP-CTERM system associated)